MMGTFSHAYLTLVVATLLTGCNSTKTVSADAQNASAAPPLIPALPAPSGLSVSDRAAIAADAKARLLTRTIGFASTGSQHLCTEYFSLGDPQVSDAALGEHTGKVKLLIPVTVYNPQNYSAGKMMAPDMDCYGYSRPGWRLNEPYNVEFQFDVERWQTGWRVSQVQANGF